MDKDMKRHMEVTRREAILAYLFGAGAVGLRAFATGIPAALLLNPKKALAATGQSSASCLDPAKAQFLVISNSSNGDPVNGNTPGTYEDNGIVHPPAATMAPTKFTLGSTSTTAAKPWADLAATPWMGGGTLGDHMAFFHHGTYTVVHGDNQKTMELGGAVANSDMLVSMLASQLGGCLGTIQTQPICVGAQNGGEALSYQGRIQPILTPQSLASVLTLGNGPLAAANLVKLRDQTLDSLNAWYKSQGNPGQASFIDRYATSQSQLRNVAGALLNNLASIKDNSETSQILATVALIQMNIAPVVSVHFDFGGDNHGDGQLNNEAAKHVAGCQAIASLFTQLASAGLQDRVAFMMLNVFGRTMAVSHEGTNGRDHNANSFCTPIISANVKGGIVGGVGPMNGDYGATGIDSTTGASNSHGDIPFAQTFAAMGKTVGRAVGIDEAYLDTVINSGKAISTILSV